MIAVGMIYIKDEEDLEDEFDDTGEKYVESIRDNNGDVHLNYTAIHLSQKKYKEFYTEIGVKIIDDIKKHGCNVEMIEERFPPPQPIDTIAITSYEDSLILISKKGWDDLRNDWLFDRMKDPPIEKWSEVKEYAILDVLIHEFSHIIMHERHFETERDDIRMRKYSFNIYEEYKKEIPNTKLIERLEYKMNKIEHGRKFNRIYKELSRKYMSRNFIRILQKYRKYITG